MLQDVHTMEQQKQQLWRQQNYEVFEDQIHNAKDLLQLLAIKKQIIRQGDAEYDTLLKVVATKEEAFVSSL